MGIMKSPVGFVPFRLLARVGIAPQASRIMNISRVLPYDVLVVRRWSVGKGFWRGEIAPDSANGRRLYYFAVTYPSVMCRQGLGKVGFHPQATTAKSRKAIRDTVALTSLPGRGILPLAFCRGVSGSYRTSCLGIGVGMALASYNRVVEELQRPSKADKNESHDIIVASMRHSGRSTRYLVCM